MDTRDRFLTATGELFRSNGYRGTSLADITGAAGAPVGSLYHFFPGGKAELATEVVRSSGAAYLALFDLVAADTEDPVEALRTFFDGAADTLAETNYVEICPIGAVAREMASSDDSIRSAAAEVFATWIAALAHRLHAAGLQVEESAELAATVIATLEGTFGIARTRRDVEVVRAAGRHMGQLVELALAATNTSTV